MVSQSNLDHITREQIRAAASPMGTKAERPNEAVVARDQTKPKKTNKIKPRYRTNATLLNRIRYHNGAIGLLFGRRLRYILFGFVVGYGMRFWQNVDEEATKRKEKEEERKKKAAEEAIKKETAEEKEKREEEAAEAEKISADDEDDTEETG